MVSLDKAVNMVEKVLEMRERGYSQQETARILRLDRSFVSRLEAAGEVRRGERVAVIGFPVANAPELSALCLAYGLDYYLLLNNRERWEMVRNREAMSFFNSVLEIIARLREYDTLIMITSVKWRRLAEALLDTRIIHIDLGPTPIQEDCPVDPERFRSILSGLLGCFSKEAEITETCCRD